MKVRPINIAINNIATITNEGDFYMTGCLAGYGIFSDPTEPPGHPDPSG